MFKALQENSCKILRFKDDFMKETGSRLTDWAVNKIKTDFKEDVCLLLAHDTLHLPGDQVNAAFSYYIPATNRSNGLARTFIIDGIGYDLFPMSWERIENTADLKEYNTTCLADGKILYARNEDDRRRFTSLQEKLQANLKNPHYMRERASKWLGTVVEIYHEMLFEERLYKIHEYAGYICDLLSIAVAFVNQKYFKHGQTNQIAELQNMEKLPEGFTELYKNIIKAPQAEEQKKICHEMIARTRAFLDENNHIDHHADRGKADFSELAMWYQELSYTWRRVYYWCDQNDFVNAYIWACMLQNEVERTGNEFGITDIDILGSFDTGNLPLFRKRAALVEAVFVKAIKENGVTLDSYRSIDDFLAGNN
jgi:hypothetical protein